MSEYKFGTLAIHAGSEADKVTGAVINPISLSTTYAQLAAAKPVGAYEYSRSDNPNRSQFETVVAALEKGKYGLAYSSGSAVTANILQAFQNSHVVSIGDVYGGTHRYFTKVAGVHGIETSFTNKIHDELEKLIKPETRIVWIESPSNPTLTITDIAAVAKVVKNAQKTQEIYLVVDNTFLSPYIQNPLQLGADLVVHSVSKYINGHSDVIMGVAVTSNETLNSKLRFLQNAIGAIPSPFDSWLAHRGVKTLHLRMKAASESALQIAKYLESRIGSEVVAVNYPGLESNPAYEVVQRQHRNGLGGGMISFRIKGGAEQASKFCAESKLFTFAESLGGVESLCEVPAAMTHAGIPQTDREASGVYDNLIRLSVGVEDVDDLLEDIKRALTASV